MLRHMGNPRDGVGIDRAVALAERVMGLDLSRKVRGAETGTQGRS